METCSECGEDRPGTSICEECDKAICSGCYEGHDCGKTTFEEKINKVLGLS